MSDLLSNKIKSFLIHLPKIKSSLDSALESKAGLEKIGIYPTMFEGSYGPEIEKEFDKEGREFHNIEGIKINRKTAGTGAKGVFHSHYRLWKHCIELNEPIMVFEDDVIVTRKYNPIEFDEVLIISINYDWDLSLQWNHFLEKSNNHTTAQPYTSPFMPGTSGYIIKPVAAKKLVDEYTKSFIISDVAMNSNVIKMEIHPQLIGRSKTMDEKVSLVRLKSWENQYTLQDQQ
jgi:GR25 family glycosyltransferase involved in LPS biosynthesis